MDSRDTRLFRLTVDKPDGSKKIVQSPLTCEFDIARDNMSSVNTANIRLFNLSIDSRTYIRRDFLDPAYGIGVLLEVSNSKFESYSTVFEGTIDSALSKRTGVNFVTTIVSNNGYFAYVNSKETISISKGESKNNVINRVLKLLAKDFGIRKGAVSSFPGVYKRGLVLTGSILEILREIVGPDGYFIDNNIAHILTDNEIIAGSVFQIDADNGLIGTPVRNGPYVNFDIIFEPRLKIGQALYITSIADKSMTGTYSVEAIYHKGTISEAVNSSCITSIICRSSKDPFKPVLAGG